MKPETADVFLEKQCDGLEGLTLRCTESLRYPDLQKQKRPRKKHENFGSEDTVWRPK